MGFEGEEGEWRSGGGVGQEQEKEAGGVGEGDRGMVHGHVLCLLLTQGTAEECSLQLVGEAAIGTVCMGCPGPHPPRPTSKHLPHRAQLSSSLTLMKWARTWDSAGIPLPCWKTAQP